MTASAFACVLASSSAGNATLFSAGNTHILLDAGLTSKRMLVQALARFSLSVYDLTAVLITHEHSDHTACLPHIPPNIPVYASFGASVHIFGTPRVAVPNQAFTVHDVQITPFSTPHDTPDSLGYLVEYGGFSAALATDMGYMPDDALTLLKTARVLFLESNYDEGMLRTGRYPMFLKKRIAGRLGHLSNTQCAAAALDCINGKTEHLVLMHLSKDNNTPEIAYETTRSVLAGHGAGAGNDFTMQVAPRSQPGQPVYAAS
jgi:phosphoribosyl 1,2-cyclic phosphodiesterase